MPSVRFDSRGDGTEAPEWESSGTSSIGSAADYDVLTPERVSLRYDLAGIGSRGAAALLDTLIQGTIWVVFSLAFAAAVGLWQSRFPGTLSSDAAQGILILAYALITFLLLWGYFLLFEIAWN